MIPAITTQLGKTIAGGTPGTPLKPPGPMKLTRATVVAVNQMVNGIPVTTVRLPGSKVAVPAEITIGTDLAPGDVVEVATAGTRVIILAKTSTETIPPPTPSSAGQAPSGFLGIQHGPDPRAWSSGFIAPLSGLGDFSESGGSIDGAYVYNLPLWNNPGSFGSNGGFSWVGSWLTFPGFSGSWFYAITEFPTLFGPSMFAGGPIGVRVLIWACDLAFTNYQSYGANFTLTSGEQKTLATGDFTAVATTGTDLSLNAGTGSGPTDFGNGIVSGTAVSPYLGGTTVWVDSIPAGTVFD